MYKELTKAGGNRNFKAGLLALFKIYSDKAFSIAFCIMGSIIL